MKILTLTFLSLMTATAMAEEVDNRLDAASDGVVSISNVAGTIEVIGWSRNEVEVTGTLGRDVEELIFERDGDEIEIEHSVTVFSSLTCDQRLDGAGGCLPEGVALPRVFFGSVRIQATEPVAIVAQRVSGDGALADYRGFTVEEASREVVLPVWSMLLPLRRARMRTAFMLDSFPWLAPMPTVV